MSGRNLRRVGKLPTGCPHESFWGALACQPQDRPELSGSRSPEDGQHAERIKRAAQPICSSGGRSASTARLQAPGFLNQEADQTHRASSAQTSRNSVPRVFQPGCVSTRGAPWPSRNEQARPSVEAGLPISYQAFGLVSPSSTTSSGAPENGFTSAVLVALISARTCCATVSNCGGATSAHGSMAQYSPCGPRWPRKAMPRCAKPDGRSRLTYRHRRGKPCRNGPPSGMALAACARWSARRVGDERLPRVRL